MSVEKGSQMLMDEDIRLVCVTLGEKGCYYRYENGNGYVPAYHVDAVDTNAAGDVFTAAVLVSLLRQNCDINRIDSCRMHDIMRVANAASAICVSRVGAIYAAPTLEDLQHFFEQCRRIRQGVAWNEGRNAMNIGIWGTGVIAAKMADTIRRMEDVTLYACASRTQERANCFANDYNCYKAYGSAEDMLQDREVDLVYIATPNFAHYDNTIACLRHGKAVLCEKPFALNYTQAKEMIELATEKHILLAEAMWMRYQPLAAKIVELINDGVIGKSKTPSCQQR